MSGKRREKQKLTNQIDEELIEYYNTKNIDLSTIKINKKFKNKKQKDLFKLINDSRITFINGPAGTGKSFIALMAAVSMILDKTNNINKIQLTKPIVESAKSIGFLKGTVEDKTGPYFDSFYDNFKKLIGKSGLKFLTDNNYIEHTILNFIRGNTFGEYDVDSNPIGHICVLDECQNMTVNEMKTFISRLGNEESRMIILGDIDQMDIKLKPGEQNGLEWCFENLRDIESVDFFEFGEEDIVRSKILIEIMKRFKLFS